MVTESESADFSFLQGMQDDKIGKVAKTDGLILQLGTHLSRKIRRNSMVISEVACDILVDCWSISVTKQEVAIEHCTILSIRQNSELLLMQHNTALDSITDVTHTHHHPVPFDQVGYVRKGCRKQTTINS